MSNVTRLHPPTATQLPAEAIAGRSVKCYLLNVKCYLLNVKCLLLNLSTVSIYQ